MDYHSVIVTRRIRHLGRYLDEHFPFTCEAGNQLYERIDMLKAYTFWKTVITIVSGLLLSVGIGILANQWHTLAVSLKGYVAVSAMATTLILGHGCIHLYHFWAWKKFCQRIQHMERIARQFNLDPVRLRDFPGWIALQYQVLPVADDGETKLLCQHTLTYAQAASLRTQFDQIKFLENPQDHTDIRPYLEDLIYFFYFDEESMLSCDLESWLDEVEGCPETSSKPY